MRRWLALALLGAVSVAGCAYTPPRAALAPPALAESTRIYDVHGRLITRLRSEENRENVRLSELPSHLLDAVVAIEDDRFWEHRGIDVKAILRAAVTNTSEGEAVEGGSTITQQYVKTALVGNEKTVNRKVKEALLAVQLERSSTKERILELYLNTIYFGNGAYGVQAASQEYFGIDAADINVAQSALLAALIQAPSTHDPYDNPDGAATRRDVVLDRMATLGYLDDATVAYAKLQPLVVRLTPAEERYPAPHFVEQVKRFLLDDQRFGETAADRRQLLFGGGLRIHTTLDLDKQSLAEEAVDEVRPPQPGPDAALVSMVPATGYVEALVGGRDFFSGGERAKLDLVTGGPGRPAGSAFKPLVLAAALDQGITLDRVYEAPSRLTIPLPTGDWEVENYEGTAGESATLFEATVRSYNTVYAQLIIDVGPEEAMAMARRLGVQAKLSPYPSAVLGTNDVHPIDMATAYATLANRGLRVDPVFVTKVTKTDGTILYQHMHDQRRALDEQVADEVTHVLQQAVERGTGTRARLADRAVAGKTGTGQEWRDAWFVGFTPDVVTAVWMGFAEQGKKSMAPPATPLRVTGGSWPATIWRLYSEAALRETPVSAFPDVIVRSEDERPEEGIVAIVPDLDGLSLADARSLLERHGYLVRMREVPRNDVEPGTVVGQSPAAGTALPLGQVVVVNVATTRVPTASVPNVLGLRERNAIRELQRAGFDVEVIHADGGEPGQVWQQSPAAGTSVPIGATVHIWITPRAAADTTPSTETTSTTTAATTDEGPSG